jgi:CPA2 family monovalent cation:H+ antiporter-2
MGALMIVMFAGGLLADRLRQSLIPAYIFAGVLCQRYVPEGEFVQVLAEVGLVLLLFFIGMEFSLKSFLASWHRTLRAGSIDLLFNFPVGVAFGLFIGLSLVNSMYVGAIVYMSSTAIITKTMVDGKLTAMPESETVLRVLVFEDLFIAVVLAVFAAMAGGNSFAPSVPLIAVLKVVAFFGVLALIFRLILPIVNRIFDVESEELFSLAALGFVLFVSGLADKVGISEAVGAFAAGMLFAETRHRVKAEEMLLTIKDMTAAVFFFNFGLMISLSGIGPALGPAIVLVGLSFASKLMGGYVIGKAAGLSTRGSFGVGFGLLARGEFSIIVASLVPPGVIAVGLGCDLPTLAAVYVLISGVLGAMGMKEYPHIYQLMKKRLKRSKPETA